MKFKYWNPNSEFVHEQDINFGEEFYVIGSAYRYKVTVPKMRYKITVEDEGIPVCEVRFNDADLANIIGEQLTRLIGNIMPVGDDTHGSEYPFWRNPEHP